MFEQMIKLSQIAESFEKQGNAKAGAILTDSMKKIAILITDPHEKGEELWRHRKRVFDFVKHRYPTLSAQEIEDAVQDAILEILKSSRPLDTSQNIVSYFIQSALNNAGGRKQRREQFEESETGMGPQFGDTDDGMTGMIESQQDIRGTMGTRDDPTALGGTFNAWINPKKRKTEVNPKAPAAPIIPETEGTGASLQEPEIVEPPVEEPKVSQEQIQSMFGSPQELLTEAIFGGGTKEEIASGALVEPAIEFMKQSLKGRGGLQNLLQNPSKLITDEVWSEALRQILALYFSGLRGHRMGGGTASTTGNNLEAIRNSIPGLNKLNKNTFNERASQVYNALKLSIIEQELAKQRETNPNEEQAIETTIASFPNPDQMTQFLSYDSSSGSTPKHKLPLSDLIRMAAKGGFGSFPSKNDYMRILGYVPEKWSGQGSKTGKTPVASKALRRTK